MTRCARSDETTEWSLLIRERSSGEIRLHDVIVGKESAAAARARLINHFGEGRRYAWHQPRSAPLPDGAVR
jgi:hypothetical protein